MEITEVRIRRVSGEGRVRAVASITLNNAFAVHDVRLVEGEKGLFVSMPSRRRVSGEYYDVAHPITAEARSAIHKAVIKAFGEQIQQAASAVSNEA